MQHIVRLYHFLLGVSHSLRHFTHDIVIAVLIAAPMERLGVAMIVIGYFLVISGIATWMQRAPEITGD